MNRGTTETVRDWLLWIGALLLSFVCYVVPGVLWWAGLLVVPVLAWRRAWTLPLGVLPQQWSPEWAYLWSNEVDGIFGPETSNSPSTRRWIERARNWSDRRRAISWCALRNPVANLKWTWFGVTLERSRMSGFGVPNAWEAYKAYRMRGSRPVGNDPRSTPPFVTLARQGWRAGLWVVWAHNFRRFGIDLTRRHTILRLGWKVYPGYLQPLARRVAMTAQVRILSHDLPDWYDNTEAAPTGPVLHVIGDATPTPSRRASR